MYTVESSVFAPQCNELFEQLPPHIKDRHTSKTRREMIEREAAFASLVVHNTLELAEQHDGPITALFDVDETITKDLHIGSERITYTRPSYAATVQTLSNALGDRFDTGLLTLRSQHHLNQELASPTYTSEVVAQLNPDFVISSRDGDIFTQHKSLQAMQSGWAPDDISLAAIRKIIKPALTEAVEKNDYKAIAQHADRSHWFDPKLAILQVLGDEHPDRGFVFVDDLPYTTALDPAHQQIRGVHVGNGADFRLW